MLEAFKTPIGGNWNFICYWTTEDRESKKHGSKTYAVSWMSSIWRLDRFLCLTAPCNCRKKTPLENHVRREKKSFRPSNRNKNTNQYKPTRNIFNLCTNAILVLTKLEMKSYHEDLLYLYITSLILRPYYTEKYLEECMTNFYWIRVIIKNSVKFFLIMKLI